MDSQTPERSAAVARALLPGRWLGAGRPLAIIGPAVVVSIAYMDPGNFATNIQAGAGYGYQLLWVVVLANVVAMIFQALSARLGIATGRNLAETCRERLPSALVWPMWAVSEIAAMATDLAEFVGGAIGFSLLFGIPLLWGMVATAIITYAILLIERNGFRPMELVIGGLVAVIGACYLVQLVIADVDWGAAATGMVVPNIPDSGALLIAVGIVGATVMPHAVYLHSGLSLERARGSDDAERGRLLRFSNIEVFAALGAAGLVNMAMVIMAASAFHAGHEEVAEIGTAYHTLGPLLGAGAAAVFLASLIASGLSSSVVGTMAGQMIMQGFIGVRIPLWVRRVVTMLPAFAVVLAGVDPTEALVGSQVVLSLALPVPMIALLWFVGDPDVMGRFAVSRRTLIIAAIAAAVVLILNLVLLVTMFGGIGGG